MAITINGSGTISGLSAGGLPDASITAADLASTLDLTGKTVTLPAGTGGKVLQVVYDFSTVETAFSGTAINTTPYSLSITPSSTSSKILLNWSSPFRKNSANGSESYSVYIYKDGSQLIRTDFGYMATVTTTIFNRFAMSYIDSPATTSAITYDIRLKAAIGDSYILNDTGGYGVLTAMEIAA